jgi:hypothetical protein
MMPGETKKIKFQGSSLIPVPPAPSRHPKSISSAKPLAASRNPFLQPKDVCRRNYRAAGLSRALLLGRDRVCGRELRVVESTDVGDIRSSVANSREQKSDHEFADACHVLPKLD